MFSDVQIIGGQYSHEYEMGGFISKVGESYYYFYIQLRQLSVLKSINFGYNDFELFKEFVNDSNLSKGILGGNSPGSYSVKKPLSIFLYSGNSSIAV